MTISVCAKNQITRSLPPSMGIWAPVVRANTSPHNATTNLADIVAGDSGMQNIVLFVVVDAHAVIGSPASKHIVAPNAGVKYLVGVHHIQRECPPRPIRAPLPVASWVMAALEAE
jgi:hypothetical protein